MSVVRAVGGGLSHIYHIPPNTLIHVFLIYVVLYYIYVNTVQFVLYTRLCYCTLLLNKCRFYDQNSVFLVLMLMFLRMVKNSTNIFCVCFSI